MNNSTRKSIDARGCFRETDADEMSWPDVCDHCYWRANLSANLAAAGMAAAIARPPERCDCYLEDGFPRECSSCHDIRTMREAVS